MRTAPGCGILVEGFLRFFRRLGGFGGHWHLVDAVVLGWMCLDLAFHAVMPRFPSPTLLFQCSDRLVK